MHYEDASNQDRFLGRVRKALGHDPDRRRSPQDLIATVEPSETAAVRAGIAARTHEARLQLLDALLKSAKIIQLQVTPVPTAAAAAAAIAQLAQEKQPEWGTEKRLVTWRHPLIDALQLPAALADQGIPVTCAEPAEPASVDTDTEAGRQAIRRQVIDAYIGVTGADFCIAETATLVMKTRPGQGRSVSLVPSIHVAVITLEQVLENLKELYAVLRWNPEQHEEGLTNCLSLISGPSKTADIELTMVHGAHGPRELHLFVITEPA